MRRARWKRKNRLGALRCSGPPRDGGRRIGACFGFAWPSGTLQSSARSILPSRGGWCRPRRGARTHLTSSSFRAFRFATRCPGDRGGLYRRADEGIRPYEIIAGLPHSVGADALIRPLHQLPRGTVSGSEKRSGMYPRLPRAEGFPKISAFPSLTVARECQLSPAGGRRSALAQTDPPNIFSFPPGAAHFLFDVSKRKWGAHYPAINIADNTVAALRFPSPGGAANRAASSKAPRFIRHRRRFGAFPTQTGGLPFTAR